MTIARRYTAHHLSYKIWQESFVADKTFRKYTVFQKKTCDHVFDDKLK